MKLAVVGPGAMGIFFASRLARARCDVTLIDQDRQRARRLVKRGIVVLADGSDEPVRIPVTTASSLAAGASFDLVLFFVKAYATVQAALQIAPWVRPGGLALTLQNGLGNAEAIAAVLPEARVAAGATGLGATWVSEGVVRYAGNPVSTSEAHPPTMLGPHADTRLSDCERVPPRLRQAGIETAVAPECAPIVWRKACINAAVNPLTALLQVTNGALASSADCRCIMESVLAECVTVAGSVGVHLGRENYLEQALAVCHNTAANQSSMLQDIRRGRRTEIEQINGAVANLARNAGLHAPANTILATLVRILSRKTAERQRT